jgi:hypothetical protein
MLAFPLGGDTTEIVGVNETIAVIIQLVTARLLTIRQRDLNL